MLLLFPRRPLQAGEFLTEKALLLTLMNGWRFSGDGSTLPA